MRFFEDLAPFPRLFIPLALLSAGLRVPFLSGQWAFGWVSNAAVGKYLVLNMVLAALLIGIIAAVCWFAGMRDLLLTAAVPVIIFALLLIPGALSNIGQFGFDSRWVLPVVAEAAGYAGPALLALLWLNHKKWTA